MEGIPVSGQDGDKAALNRIALGTQTVSVWKDARELGKAAGEIAVALAGGTALDAVEGAGKFTTPGGNEMNSILLTPVADHQGQPRRRGRRRLDHQGRALRRASPPGSVAACRLSRADGPADAGPAEPAPRRPRPRRLERPA